MINKRGEVREGEGKEKEKGQGFVSVLMETQNLEKKAEAEELGELQPHNSSRMEPFSQILHLLRI